MTIYLAEFNTKHLTFRVASTNRDHMKQQLERGVRWHCEQAGVPFDRFAVMLKDGAYNTRIMETGVCYRDSWPIVQTEVSVSSAKGTKHPWHDSSNRNCPWAMGGDYCRCAPKAQGGSIAG